MTQKDKSLLFKDLSARLPYNTKVFFSIIEEDEPVELSLSVIYCLGGIPLGQNDIVIKPYLRPMSSMTEEEKNDLKEHTCPEGTGTFDEKYLKCPMSHYGERISYEFMSDILSWLNAHHFDYRGLIEKGLAIAVTEENNPYKELNYDTIHK